MSFTKKAFTKRYVIKPGCEDEVRALSATHKTVVTGYLSDDPIIRLRASDSGAWIQIWKSGEETNYEYEIPIEEAESMMNICLRRTMRSTWIVQHGGRRWRLNEYMGRHAGLFTAVLDLASRHDGFEEPQWVGRNVSGERRFTDEGLSRLQAPPRPD